ncbi:hypothetical protein CRUP_016042, partial [Coryphaenoides rupestris]
VIGRHPTCNFLLELEREKAECDEHLNTQNLNATGKGVWCKGLWDNIACWEGVEVGGVVTISCPSVLTAVFGLHGNISRRCTAAGWSDVFPNITSTCGSEPTQDKRNKLTPPLLWVYWELPSTTTVCYWFYWELPSTTTLGFYMVVQTLYTLGHSLSLIALTTGSAILCLF